MTVLAWVTGAQGFLGRSTARFLEASGFEVVRIARKPWPEGAPERSETVRLDGMGLEQVLARHGPPGLILHCAGNGSVGQSFADPVADRESAVSTTAALVALVKRHGLSATLIFPSSAAVYGERGPAPLAETLDARPLAPYGRHKLEAEDLLRSAAIDAVVIRFFSLYGNGLRKQLFWDLARRILAAQREEAIPMLGTGDETRDFMHVEDAARLALHVFHQRKRHFRLVNGASGRATSIRRAATLLRDALGRENPLCFTGEPAQGAPTHLAADVTRLRELGFRSQTALEDGIARYASWVAREIGSHA